MGITPLTVIRLPESDYYDFSCNYPDWIECFFTSGINKNKESAKQIQRELMKKDAALLKENPFINSFTRC